MKSYRQLTAADREGQFSSRIALIGCPHPRGQPSTHVHVIILTGLEEGKEPWHVKAHADRSETLLGSVDPRSKWADYVLAQRVYIKPRHSYSMLCHPS